MKKSTRVNLLIALAYCVFLFGTIYLGQKFLNKSENAQPSNTADSKDEQWKNDDIAHIIKKKYVDDINIDSIQFLPIDSMLHQLDPHSSYLPPPSVAELNESLEGGFEGVGVEYYILNDTLLVTKIVNNGPAFKAGLKLGDKILKIDSTIVSGRKLPLSSIGGRMKGKKGTAVQLMVQRQGLGNPILLTIRRARVNVSSIEASYMINPDIGYIKISKFGASTDADFINALRLLKSKGMKKMILDLRDNGGGYLSAATGLANQFFSEKKLIVYTQGRHEPRTDYYTTGNGEFENGKLVVLINENTASASEIFAGAIQDYKRGQIIGRRSFGKGLVQEQFVLEDGSAVNLTIARYYTPLGRNIQKPYNKGYKVYQNEIEERYNSGELTAEPDKADSMFSAMNSLNKDGKKVFNAGGIQPDVYIKLDTIGLNKFFTNLIQKRILYDFVFDVLADRYSAEYLHNVYNSFNISDKDYIDFLKYLEWRKINMDQKQLIKAKVLIYKNLKLLLYKYYLGENGFNRIQNQDDPMIKQALISLDKN